MGSDECNVIGHHQNDSALIKMGSDESHFNVTGHHQNDSAFR